MSLETASGTIREKLGYAAGLDASVKFDFGDEGVIHVDARQNPPVLTHEDAEADVVLSCSLETFENILSGAQDPNIAFMFGKLKIQGNMKLAMKLNAILEV
ncbi:MAG: SCP2 sterol-binding domain-containing protein [Alphaproteobacteria bacterium]|nr:SCP2 sterol-binding domain-containing protein [Alphaproteobacteria bacterium]